MGKYYCDYCDIYLTHDSMSARKAHNTGRNHISNVRDYFASLGHDTAQSIIDQIVQSHENGGRAAMMAAPSMRLGAGFMNPMGPAMPSMGNDFHQPQPPFPPTNFPSNGPPPFRPPFPPTNPGFQAPPPTLPPFPPSNTNGGFRPPPPGLGMGPPGMAPPAAQGPPGGFAPVGLPPVGAAGASGAAPGIHPDRLRMMGV